MTQVCMDMSLAFIKADSDHFHKAAITFDKFHVIQAVNKAVDRCKDKSVKAVQILKNNRYIWLKNEQNLTTNQKEKLDWLKDCDIDTEKAYRMRITLQRFYRYPAVIAHMA